MGLCASKQCAKYCKLRINFFCRAYCCCCCALSPSEIVRDRFERTKASLENNIRKLQEKEEQIYTVNDGLRAQLEANRQLLLTILKDREATGILNRTQFHAQESMLARITREYAYSNRAKDRVERVIAAFRARRDAVEEAITTAEYNNQMIEAVYWLEQIGMERPINAEYLDRLARHEVGIFDNISKTSTAFDTQLSMELSNQQKYKGDPKYDPETILHNTITDLPLTDLERKALYSMTRHLEREEKQERRELAVQRALDQVAEQHTGAANSREEKLLAERKKPGVKKSIFRKIPFMRRKQKSGDAAKTLVQPKKSAAAAAAATAASTPPPRALLVDNDDTDPRYVIDDETRYIDSALEEAMENEDDTGLDANAEDDVEFESKSAADDDMRPVSPTLNRLASVVTREEEKEASSV